MSTDDLNKTKVSAGAAATVGEERGSAAVCVKCGRPLASQQEVDQWKAHALSARQTGGICFGALSSITALLHGDEESGDVEILKVRLADERRKQRGEDCREESMVFAIRAIVSGDSADLDRTLVSLDAVERELHQRR